MEGMTRIRHSGKDDARRGEIKKSCGCEGSPTETRSERSAHCDSPASAAATLCWHLIPPKRRKPRNRKPRWPWGSTARASARGRRNHSKAASGPRRGQRRRLLRLFGVAAVAERACWGSERLVRPAGKIRGKQDDASTEAAFSLAFVEVNNDPVRKSRCKHGKSLTNSNLDIRFSNLVVRL